MKSYNRLIALTVFYESFNDSYDSATWLPHNHNRVDKQNAVKGRFGVNTAMHYALFAKNAAVLTTRTPWKADSVSTRPYPNTNRAREKGPMMGRVMGAGDGGGEQ